MTKQQLREYVQRWFDCYDTEWGGDADSDSSNALREVLACLADEPRGEHEGAFELSYDRALDKLVMARTFMTLEAQQAFDEEWARHMQGLKPCDE